MSELDKIMQNERTKDVIGMTFSIGVIIGSVALIGYVYDLKYGSRAMEKWKMDSINEVKYDDSLKRIGNDIGSDTVYHLKLQPKVLMYPDYEVNKK